MRDKTSIYNQKSVSDISYEELNADRNSRRKLTMPAQHSNITKAELYG